MTAAVPEPKENMGKPSPRYEARLKVTGEARYPADMPTANPAYAFLVTSAVALGEIRSMDLAEAKALPGVLDILTHENASGIRPSKLQNEGGNAGETIVPLSSRAVWHDGQIVAMVLADSFESARDAAHRIHVDYETRPPSASFDSPAVEEIAVAAVVKSHEDPAVGDAAAAFAAAAVRVEAEYSTPAQHHNPMELFSTTCFWSGDKLTIYEPSQFVHGLRSGVAEQLGIDAGKVHVVSSYVGGAFGSKGSLKQSTAIVALAAKRLGRPVKLVITRDQGFTVGTYRAETRHAVKLGAGRDGKIAAYLHEGSEITSRPDNYFVAGTDNTARMYGFGTVATKVRIVHADRNTPGYMRSPPEVPYMFALESAMDELAVALAMDPVELRRINDTQVDPITGKLYSSRSLMRCYDEAAKEFGWERRSPAPGSMRDGDWLVGWGCATASYPTQVSPAAARVKLTPDAKVQVETAAHDVGTGAYTVIAQTAAEKLGVELDAVSVVIADSDLPPAPVAGGSVTTASVCSAVMKACDAIREKLFQAAVSRSGPLSGRNPGELEMKAGAVFARDGSSDALSAVIGHLGRVVMEEHAEWVPPSLSAEAMAGLYKGKVTITGGPKRGKLMYAFGAEFVEVRINARTREVRVPRAVGAFAAGRILNPRTTHSQLMGGMIWGISAALHEATELDVRHARYINDNLADYLVPVNADIGRVDVHLVPEVDDDVNPAGVKGLGELGNVGTNAAVANAVYHATGLRIRDLPIRIEKLLTA